MPNISFEFFPPKTDELEAKLWDSILALAPLPSRFVSVTYGAGGSTRERTHSLVKRIKDETSLKPAAHLTCVNASKADVNAIAKDYWDAGIQHIVALRGDPPKGSDYYTPHPEGYAYADELVVGLKEIADFEISVAAYPETHPEAPSANADIEHLKRKLDAGATRAITQYFFDTDLYFRFMDKLEKAGIDADITPGILPIVNYKQMVQFSNACGTSVPDWIHERFADVDDAEATIKLGIEIAAQQCQKLLENNVTNLHFYTLNRANVVIGICDALGIKPNTKAA